MTRRLISDRTRTWLLDELQAWRDAAIVSEEQQDRILNLYETTDDVSQRKRSRAAFALMSVAAFFIGLGALLLIGYNWDDMPSPVKLVIVLGTIIATYGLAGWLRYSKQAPRSSEILFFLGCLFYGCGIWLIAQIFHISGHYPNALWIWALGALPIALCLDTLLLHALVVTLLATWVGTEILGFGLMFDPWLFARWFRLPSACYSLPLLALPGLLWAYRKRSPETASLYVAAVAWWIVLQPVAWRADSSMPYIIGAAGAILLAIAELHPTGSRMAIPFRFFGVVIVGGLLSVLSFGDAIRGLLWSESAALERHLVTAIGIGLVGVAVIVLADLAASRRLGIGRAGGIPFISIAGRQWLPIGVIALMSALCAWIGAFSEFHGSPMDKWSLAVIVPTLATNAAMLGFAGWLIYVSLREDRGITFAAGVLLILLWSIFRYIDLFSGVGGMLGASLMFFLCGAALYGMSRFWLHRKEILHV